MIATSETIDRVRLGEQQISREQLVADEFIKARNGAETALFSAFFPLIAAEARGERDETTELFSDAIAKNVALSFSTTNTVYEVGKQLSIPEYVFDNLSFYVRDPSMQAGISAVLQETQRQTENLMQEIEYSFPDIHPSTLINQAEYALQTAAGNELSVPRVWVNPRTGLPEKENIAILDEEAWSVVSQDILEAITAVRSQRMVQLFQHNPLIHSSIMRSYRRAQGDPAATAEWATRFTGWLERHHHKLHASNRDISSYFRKQLEKDLLNNDFFDLFDTASSSGQVDILVWATAGISTKDVRAHGSRIVLEIENSAQALADRLETSKDGVKEMIQSWEQQLVRLFDNATDWQTYAKTFSDRQRATVLALALNNTMPLAAKIQYLNHEPGAFAVIQALGGMRHGDRFSGWQEAAAVAATIKNHAARIAMNQVPGGAKAAMKLYGGDHGIGNNKPEPPRNGHGTEILLLSTIVLSAILAACSPPNDGTTTPAAPTSTPAATLTPEAMITATSTPAPFPTTISGNPDSGSGFIVAPGVPAGVGGPGELSPFYNSPEVQNALVGQDYALVYYAQPLYNQDGTPQLDTNGNPLTQNILSWTDASGACWFNAPQQIFDPNFHSETLSSVDQGIAHFDPDDGGAPMEAFMKVDISNIPPGYACLGAIMNEPGDDNYTQFRVLLINTATNEVIGWMQAAWVAGDHLTFVQSADGHFGIQAGGKTLQWIAEHTLDVPMEILYPTSCFDQAVIDRVVAEFPEKDVVGKGTRTVEQARALIRDPYDGRSASATYLPLGWEQKADMPARVVFPGMLIGTTRISMPNGDLGLCAITVDKDGNTYPLLVGVVHNGLFKQTTYLIKWHSISNTGEYIKNMPTTIEKAEEFYQAQIGRSNTFDIVLYWKSLEEVGHQLMVNHGLEMFGEDPYFEEMTNKYENGDLALGGTVQDLMRPYIDTNDPAYLTRRVIIWED